MGDTTPFTGTLMTNLIPDPLDYRPMPEPRTILAHLKASAKSRKIECDLTVFDVYNFDFPIQCPILGIPLHWYRNAARDDSYSFDRIDSAQGYSFDNIQVLSLKANRAKNNLSEAELKLFSKFYACSE